MIRLLIADDEKLEREALAELVQRRFEREVVLEMAENGRKAAGKGHNRVRRCQYCAVSRKY